MPSPTPEQAAELLTFLSVFENPNYSPGEVVIREGQLPFHTWDAQLSEFVQLLYQFGLILPRFDWSSWTEEAERYVLEPATLQHAPAEDVWKLLTLHVRQDRFFDGHLSHMVSVGHIAAVLRRLAVLYNDTERPSL